MLTLPSQPTVPTVDDLLGLPYGDTVPSGVPTTDGLLALDYTGGPAFSRGLTAQSYRERMRANGERVQWLRAVPSTSTRTGLAFVAETLDAGVRVSIYSNERNIQDEEFGVIAKGETMMSWMPDEIDPQRNDRFVALDRPGQPTYELLFERVKQAPEGQDDKRLPASAPLRLIPNE